MRGKRNKNPRPERRKNTFRESLRRFEDLSAGVEARPLRLKNVYKRQAYLQYMPSDKKFPLREEFAPLKNKIFILSTLKN